MNEEYVIVCTCAERHAKCYVWEEPKIPSITVQHTPNSTAHRTCRIDVYIERQPLYLLHISIQHLHLYRKGELIKVVLWGGSSFQILWPVFNWRNYSFNPLLYFLTRSNINWASKYCLGWIYYSFLFYNGGRHLEAMCLW